MIDKNFDTYTKIVGVTKENDKGTNIQDILPLLSEDGRLILIRDFGNLYDENAIKVYYHTKKESIHIGYLNRELAANLSVFLDENPTFDIDGIVDEITGGEGKTYGCNIRIWIQDPDEPNYDEIKAFQEHLKNQPKEKPPTADEKILNGVFEEIYSKSKTPSTNSNFSHSRFKDFFIALITILTIVGFIGFIIIINKEPAYSNNDYKTDFTSSALDTVNNEPSLPNISINDIQFNFNIEGPNLIDYYELVGTYQNNSQYTITKILLTISVNNGEDKLLTSCEEFVVPGDSSAQFDTTGTPCIINDYKITECYIDFLDENADDYTYHYDAATGENKIY